MSKRRALGRGLGALIPGAHDETAPEQMAAPQVVPLQLIRPNALQPRQKFADEQIDELAASIREKGILQPLLVRPVGGGFELIAGERRFRAAQRAGLVEVPVSIRQADDREALELALVENIQRENLNGIEEACAYRRLIDEFDLTQEGVAARVGKDRSTISNALRLLQLPESIQGDIQEGRLSAGHARALVTMSSDAARLALAREIVSKKLSVRDAEQKAKRDLLQRPDADHQAAEQQLTETFGTRVRLVHRRDGSGRIEIHYHSLGALNALIDRLTGP